MTTTKPFLGECHWREAGFAYNERRLLYYDVFYYKDDLSWLETLYFLFHLYSCFLNSCEFQLFTLRTNRRLLHLDPRYIKCTAVIAVVKLKYFNNFNRTCFYSQGLSQVLCFRCFFAIFRTALIKNTCRLRSNKNKIMTVADPRGKPEGRGEGSRYPLLDLRLLFNTCLTETFLHQKDRISLSNWLIFFYWNMWTCGHWGSCHQASVVRCAEGFTRIF